MLLWFLWCSISIFNPPSFRWEIPSSLITSSGLVSVSLPNLPPCFLTSQVNLPSSPFNGGHSKCSPTLANFSANLSTACCGFIYSPSAIEPTNPLTTSKTFSSWMLWAPITLSSAPCSPDEPTAAAVLSLPCWRIWVLCEDTSVMCCLKVFLFDCQSL